MERRSHLLAHLVERYLSRFATDWNFDRQNNLFPRSLDDLGLLTLGLDYVVKTRGLPQLTRVGLTFSPQCFGPSIEGLEWHFVDERGVICEAK